MKKKSIISILVAVLLLVSLAVPAYADTDPFAELKAAVENGTVHNFAFREKGKVEIRENITIREDMTIEAQGTTWMIPNGVTVTVKGKLITTGIRIALGGKLKIDGEDGGDAQVVKRGLTEDPKDPEDNKSTFEIKGTLELTNGGELDIDLAHWNVIRKNNYESNLSASNGSRILVNERVSDISKLLDTMNALASMQVSEHLNGSVERSCDVTVPWTVDADFSIPEGIRVNVLNRSNKETGSLAVQQAGRLTVSANSHLSVWDSSLTVAGSIRNQGEIELIPNGGTTPTFTLENGAAYSGDGLIGIRTHDSEAPTNLGIYLYGFNLSEVTACDETGNFGEYLYRYAGQQGGKMSPLQTQVDPTQPVSSGLQVTVWLQEPEDWAGECNVWIVPEGYDQVEGQDPLYHAAVPLGNGGDSEFTVNGGTCNFDAKNGVISCVVDSKNLQAGTRYEVTIGHTRIDFNPWFAAPATVAVYDPAKVLTLPSDLTTIETEAFAGVNAQLVEIPAGVTEVGSKAFANSSVIAVRYPDGLVIPEDAFDNYDQVILESYSY